MKGNKIIARYAVLARAERSFRVRQPYSAKRSGAEIIFRYRTARFQECDAVRPVTLFHFKGITAGGTPHWQMLKHGFISHCGTRLNARVRFVEVDPGSYAGQFAPVVPRIRFQRAVFGDEVDGTNASERPFQNVGVRAVSRFLCNARQRWQAMQQVHFVRWWPTQILITVRLRGETLATGCPVITPPISEDGSYRR